MQDADDWDKNVKHYLKLRGYDVANYRGNYSLNPYSVPGIGYIAGDIVLDNNELYLSLEGTFDTPNMDGLGLSKWKQLTGGNAGLQFFAESQKNDTSQWTPVGANNIAITPNGTGAITGAIPDNTSTGGNPRGEYAVDLQLDRSDPSQVASGNYSIVGGGRQNQSTNRHSTVAGGIGNQAVSDGSTVSGGSTNRSNGLASTIGGGRQNQTGDTDATVSGGYNNSSTGVASTIGGCQGNQASAPYATVAGGYTNSSTGVASTIGGGEDNQTSALYATVAGGGNNNAGTFGSMVGGGINNNIIGTFNQYGTISGGKNNQIIGDFSTIAGGDGNRINGVGASINYAFCVGLNNSLNASYSTAVGQHNFPGAIGGSPRIFMVGNGTGTGANRRNAFSVTDNGNIYSQGALTQNTTADFAEYLQFHGEIPKGTSVVMDQGKVRAAKDTEVPFGVISSHPAIIGNAAEEEWFGKYLRHPDGRPIMETYEYTEEVPKTVTKTITTKKLVPKEDPDGTQYSEEQEDIVEVQKQVYQDHQIRDPSGKVLRVIQQSVMITITKTSERPKLNPQFDPTKKYIPRSHRPYEWQLIGMLGQIPVRKQSPKNPKWQWIREINSKLDLYLIISF